MRWKRTTTTVTWPWRQRGWWRIAGYRDFKLENRTLRIVYLGPITIGYVEKPERKEPT